MPPTVHALLGYSTPAVKNGQVHVAMLIGQEWVVLVAAPETWAQLAADIDAAEQLHRRTYRGSAGRKSDTARAAAGLPILKPGGKL